MVAGLLLTGGASTRMGVDKATIEVDGQRLVDRAAGLLGAVCQPVIEVGRGYTGLEWITEEPPGSGPLVALAAGGAALRRRDHHGPAIALATDLPLLSERFLRFLAAFPGEGTVVPFVQGQPQPVCARYSARALEVAADAVKDGHRSIRTLLPRIPDLQWAGPQMWANVAEEAALTDVDTPEDLRRLGLATDPGRPVEQ